MTYVQRKEMVQHLDSDVVKLIKDQNRLNSSHVIQKAVESVPTDFIGIIQRSSNGQVKVANLSPFDHTSTDKIRKWKRKISVA